MRPINLIVIHSSKSTPSESKKLTAKDIRLQHLRRGYLDCGYHYVIRLDGTVDLARPLDQPGVHAERYNFGSIAVCLVGGLDAEKVPSCTYTEAQWASLITLLQAWPGTLLFGHRDLVPQSSCPGCDVIQELRKRGYEHNAPSGS